MLFVQQRREPRLIQPHLLVRRSPERTDLLDLAPARKGLLLHPQRNDLFEVFGFRITSACLPLRHRAPGDPQQVGQSRLGQANARPQCEHHLTEGIVSLTVGVSLHRRSPFHLTHQSEPCKTLGSDTSTAGP